MDEFGIMLKPWILLIGISMFIAGAIFLTVPAFIVGVSKILDRSFDIERSLKRLEAKVFDIDRWVLKNIKWIGVIVLSDATILLGMYYTYLR